MDKRHVPNVRVCPPMAKKNRPLSAEDATGIANVIGDVMNELAALRSLADDSLNTTAMDPVRESVIVLTIGLSERLHALLDECQFRLGGMRQAEFTIDKHFPRREPEAANGN